MYWVITISCFVIAVCAYGQGADTAAGVFGIASVVMFIVKLVMLRGERNMAYKQELEAQRCRELAQRREVMLKVSYEAEMSHLIGKYGDVTNKIVFGGRYDLEAQLLVFEQAEIVVIKGTPYSMNHIVSYRVYDDSIVIPGEVTYQNETKDVARRAVLGNMVAGSFGAWLGVMTADDETTVYREPDEIEHDYSIAITIDSISNPIVKIYIGDKISKVEQVTAILNIIIRRNQLKLAGR